MRLAVAGLTILNALGRPNRTRMISLQIEPNSQRRRRTNSHPFTTKNDASSIFDISPVNRERKTLASPSCLPLGTRQLSHPTGADSAQDASR